MKQGRKVAILLVLTLVLQIMPLPAGCLAGMLDVFKVSQAAEQTSGTDGDINWSVSGTTLTLNGQGSGKMKDYGTTYDKDEKGSWYEHTTAPWWEHYEKITTVNMSGVTGIGNYAFYHFKVLKTVKGYDSATSMGSYVFAGTALTSVIWPGKLDTISTGAFQECEKINPIAIPSQVRTLGANAFSWCSSAEKITGLDNVTSIGKGAFAGCTKLTRMLVKSDKIKSVGNEAFKGVTSNMIVKTSKNRWRPYAKMFMIKGKMSRNALFIIDPVKLKVGDKTY